MNTKKVAFFLVLSVILAVSSSAYGAVEDTRYLVKSNSSFWKKSFSVRNEFKEGFTADLTDWQLRVAKVFGLEVVPVKQLYILQLSPSPLPEKPVEDISNKPGVGGKPTPTPTATPTESNRPLPSEQIPWGISAIYGNPVLLASTSGGIDINIAVLDTGVFKAHPDLENRVEQCKDFTARKQPIIDNSCDDKNGHGTHVSGIIAADGGNDGKGIYGVAPEANLWAYKVCGNNGSCWSDDIANAIKEAANNGANIINLSLGSDAKSSLISEAIEYAVSKGVLVIAAAGNDGPDIGSIDYPGADINVVSVGAFDINLLVPEWSSRGINSKTKFGFVEEGDIEFAAPGVIIESTWKDGGYVILSGTSMATPHIVGLAARLWQKDANDKTPASATRELLQKEFADDIFPIGDDDASGFGFPHL